MSTFYSKSVLRAVAGRLDRLFDEVSYFPAYDLIMSDCGGGRFLGNDRRTITEEGVEMVMRVFMRHFCKEALDEAEIVARETDPLESPRTADARSVLDVLCDEEQLDSLKQAGEKFRG